MPELVVSIVMCALLAILLVVALRRLKGTTLVAACGWGIVATLCLAALAIVQFGAEEGSSAPLRFMAAASTFCPLMAVLGAKRPQHVGWQWVVASLWLVLVWPAGQAMLAGTGLELFIAWKLFLYGLIAVGLLNYLPTKHWTASVFVALGQATLFGEFLWQRGHVDTGQMLTLGIVLFFVSALVVWWRSASEEYSSQSESAHLRHEQMWLQFRDAYGAFWALRILGRVNETAELQQWPMRLEWQGFATTDDASPTELQLAEVEQCFETLLRRFW